MLSWPANHPDADRPVDELLALARLGILDEQQGYRDGPIFLRCNFGSWCASHLGAIGIVARLIARERTGRAGPAHTSIAQGALIPTAMHWRRVENPSPSLAVGMPKGQTGATLFESGDGVWLHLMGEPTKSPMFREAMEQVRPEGQRDDPDRLFQMFDGWPEALMLRPSGEWLESFWANDVPVQPAVAPGEIFTDEQARANGYVIEVDDPELGRIAMAGSPITVDPPTRMRRFAPGLGEHTAEVLDEWKPRARATTSTARSDGAQRWPLEGVKVVDAGAYLGGSARADAARRSRCRRGEGRAARRRGHALGGVVVLRLPARASAASRSTSSRPPPGPRSTRSSRGPTSSTTTCACPRRAASASTRTRCAAVNPDIIYCHTSSYGPPGRAPTGPATTSCSSRRAAGRSRGAGEGNPPMWHRFGFMDHLCAMGSVIATLLALYHRDRTGQTQFAAGSLLGGRRADEQRDLPRRRREDRRRCRCSTTTRPASRRATGSCRSTDGWIAIAATTDDELAGAVHGGGCRRGRGRRRPRSATGTAPRRSTRSRRGRAVRAGAARPEASRSSRRPTTTPPG